MNRSKLRKQFLNGKNEESDRRFNRRRNFCVSLLRKTKTFFFGKLDHRVVSDIRKHWKVVGPLSLEEAFYKECVILNRKTISNNGELYKAF